MVREKEVNVAEIWPLMLISVSHKSSLGSQFRTLKRWGGCGWCLSKGAQVLTDRRRLLQGGVEQ